MKQVKAKEGFTRSDHPDFKDSTELKKEKFSGLRMNSLTNCAEIWLLGNLEASITPGDLAYNPNKVNEEMERVFALEKVMPDTPEGRRLGSEAEAKESTSGIILLH
jgi:hypothetical protein